MGLQGCLETSGRLGRGDGLPAHRSPSTSAAGGALETVQKRDEERDHLDLLKLPTETESQLTCANGFLGPGIQTSTNVTELQVSPCPYELFWSSHFSSPISTLGIDGLFTTFGSVCHCG